MNPITTIPKIIIMAINGPLQIGLKLSSFEWSVSASATRVTEVDEGLRKELIY
jgi:hypothetical protein